ncbi:hypothetical protein [Pedobacter mendelii]|uniref:ABC transporter permease n=1 Tax=Pedobacter mendelii TaxID=1908240 RepID=A0ABQ2BCV8_9SPHI|nr:hypothetical protein [Pedobacter mendelii]GGI23005.1 hypothetical protein GCM10008119_05500 [Pedobacter mendelii]
MNNTFNINRFGLLLKRQWLDFGKIYLISLLVVAGVLIGFYFWNTPSLIKYKNFNNVMQFRYGLFLTLGFIFISVVASSYFALLGQKARATLELMTPASTFEKFLGGVFYTAIISVATYLVLFYVIDLSFVKYINAHLTEFKLDGDNNSLVKPAESITADILNDENHLKYFLHFIAVPFLITSIFLLGSVYFNRFHYIKTAISVMIFSGVATYVTYKTASILTQGLVYVHHEGNQNNRDSTLLFILLITSALTLIFWTIAYIRLKEKEV